MTLFFYYGAGDLGDRAVRLGVGFALTSYAEVGTIATSNVEVDDPTGALALVGLKRFRVDDTACTWLRLFYGYFADRNVIRADSLVTGAARRWSVSVIDANGALNLRVLRGSAANRPAETDIARINWYLSTAFTSGITDGGYIDSGTPVDLEKADYRGRTGADLVADASGVSGKNFFTAWDQPSNSLVLHYYKYDSTLNTCTIKISGTLADIDSATVFGAALPGGELFRDPSRVYSGVYLNYGARAAAVYVENATTASTYIARDTALSDPTVKGLAHATAKANQYLVAGETEFDRISVRLSNVPAATAGLIREGMRIQVKFQHLPGYTSYTYIRISKRTVRQAGETDVLYEMDLELSNTRIIPSLMWNSGAPPDDDIDLQEGDAVALSRYQLTQEAGSGYFGPAAGLWTRVVPAFSLGAIAGATDGKVSRTPEDNIPWPYTDCGVGTGGVAGLASKAVWHRFQVDLDDETLAGVRFTIAAFLSSGSGYTTSPGGYLVGDETVICGIHTGANSGASEVTDQDDYTEVGRIGSGGGTVFVPRSLLIDSTDGYCWFILAPAWVISNGTFYCNSAANKPWGYGLTGHDTNSSSIVSGVEMLMSGTGTTPWIGLTGAVDGSNKTFGLPGWDGSGTPEIRIDGLTLAAGDYTIDTSALEITVVEAPPVGADIAGRYHFGAGVRP